CSISIRMDKQRYALYKLLGGLLLSSLIAGCSSLIGGNTTNNGSQQKKSQLKIPDCSTAPADWIVSVDPSSTEGYNIHEVATAADTKSSSPLTDLWGIDQISGPRPRMVQPGQIIELEPGDYPHSTFAMSYDLLPGHPKALSASDVQF